MSLRSLGLWAAALLSLAFVQPAAAQSLSTLSLKDAAGSTQAECVYNDGTRLFPCHMTFGWTGSAAKAWTLDASGYGGVNVFSSVLPTGAATSGKQDSLLAALGTPLQAGGNVVVASSALPTGAATASAQTTGNTSLASILSQLQGLLTTKTSPFTTTAVITPGTPVTAGRALFLACTAAGNVRVKLSSGNTLDVPVYVGPNELTNYAVTDIVAANTTATCVATVLN